MTPLPARRLVALGASNLTRGLQTVVSLARREGEVEVLAALGHGRSYGLSSRFLARELPSILDCGLWPHLRPGVPTRALITDVGNDILYGAPADDVLGWVATALGRLRTAGAEVTVTGLPMASLRRLGRLRFTAFRSVLVPSCRLDLPTVAARAEQVHAGLGRLAAEAGCRFVDLPADWYGLDPIHVRPRLWARAWQTILEGDTGRPAPKAARGEWLRLYAARPERQHLAGREQHTPQPALRLPGATVSLY